MSSETRRSGRLVMLGMCVVALSCGVFLPRSDANTPDSRFTLAREEGLFSLRADEANLYDVLVAVQEASGISFIIDPLLREQKVSTELTGLNLEGLLRSLVGSHALVYERDGDTIRLSGGALTSEQAAAPLAAAPAVAAQAPVAAPSRTPAQEGMLSNSDRPLDELTRKSGPPALVFQNAVLDTRVLLDSGKGLPIPERFRAAADTEYHVVQFDRPVSDHDRAALGQAGAEVCHYVPRNAYAVRAASDVLAAVRGVPGVLHVEPFHPWFKMSGELTRQLGRGEPSPSADAAQQKLFNVVLFRHAQDDGRIEKRGAQIVERARLDGREMLTVRADLPVVEALLADEVVQWVEVKHAAVSMNDLGADTIRATEFKRLHPTLDGSGVIVAVVDSGVDVQHRGFAINPALPTSLGVNTRVVFYEHRAGGPTSDGVIGDTDGHGTHVSGTVLGNGALSETANLVPGSGAPPYATGRFKGMAPGAKLVMIEDFNSVPEAEQTAIAYNQGARISNNSWGNSVSEYGAISLAFDALTRDADPNAPGNQQFTLVFAAGNSGAGQSDGLGGAASTIGQPGNAKNVITVGALEQRRSANNLPGATTDTDTDWQVARFSSRGPVTSTDQRIKPDIVAPGVYTISAQSRDRDYDTFSDPLVFEQDLRNGNTDTGTNYAFLSGTSMASPTAAGAAALIYQKLTQQMGRTPSPALMKALLVNGARRLNTFVYAFPPYRNRPAIVYEGFGRVDVVRSIDGPLSQASDQVILFDQDEITPVATGQTWSYPITVGPNDGGLKVTLAWTDPPGTPGSGLQLVNDIDLLVRRPDGTTGYGGNHWDFDGRHSRLLDPVVAFDVDGENNVEIVTIPDPVPGTYTIEVYGFGVPVGPQDFAVVITKGEGVQGRTEGERPHMVLDDTGRPVVAYSALDAGGFRQIFLKRWHGDLTGSAAEVDKWKEMQGQWHGVAGSLTGTGISQTLDPSRNPKVAVRGNDIFVGWVQETADISVPSHIYLKKFNGSQWVELDNSSRLTGLSKNPIYDATNLAIAVGTDGLPVVAWEQVISVDPAVRKIFLAKFNGVSWVGLGGSNATGIPGSIRSAEPDIAIDAAGRILVAWEEFDTLKIRVRRWNGSTWETFPDAGYAPLARRASLAVGPGNVPFLSWQQVGDDRVANGDYAQVYVARWNGSSWAGFAGSTTYPGVTGSTSTNTTPIRPTLAVKDDNTVMVSWQRTVYTNNAILLKKYNGSSWVGVSNSHLLTGIDSRGGLSQAPIVKVDGIGIPFVTYFNNAEGRDEVLTFSLVVDRDAPRFDGLASAAGASASSVLLSWLPASDISLPITYLIYRSPVSFGCGQTPTCNAAQVFGNQIGTTTSTTFTVGGLTGGQAYCFAVRARDASGRVESNVVIRTAGPITGSGDLDGDCLDNLIELNIGTDICLKDTDGDGMWDGWEYTYSTNNPSHTAATAMDPLDNGVDKVRTLAANDGDPQQHPDADLDGDGATNLEEFQWWRTNTHAVTGCEASPANRVGPDPTNPDTDGDGIPDGWEMLFGLNPTNPADALTDPDGDGLNNLGEYENGGDPFNPDTDGDGIRDGDEVAGGTRVDLADSDQDGLDDLQDPEPTHWDTSGNGLSDGDMVQLGHNPTDPAVVAYNCLLQETFETSSPTVAGWTSSSASPAAPFNLWHLSTANPAPNTTGISFPYERTTNRAYRVANDPTQSDPTATYNLNNLFVICQLISPVIDATGTQNLLVRWNEFYDTEPSFDQVRVFARRQNQVSWTPVTTARSGSTDGWVNRVADLSAFAGVSNLQVRFLFQANSQLNNFLGWYVDDVQICEAASITGWVRDERGRPVVGAEVQALGAGGITNRIDGHAYVQPGKIFGSTLTDAAGGYTIRALPLGAYRVKADDPSLRAEFWNGPLTTGAYGFGNHLNPGVFRPQDVVTPLQLTTPGQIGIAEFELAPGTGRGCLGVSSALTSPVLVNSLTATVWNGSTTSPAFVPYTSDRPQVDNQPDWLLSPASPNLLCDLVPGTFLPSLAALSWTYPLPQVLVREGEATLVRLTTNQPNGRLSVRAEDGGSYPIWVNGRNTGQVTPANMILKAGVHTVQLIPASGAKWVPQKVVSVPVGGRGLAVFTLTDLSGATGDLLVRAVDFFGAPVTGAQVYVDGRLIGSNDVLTGTSPLTEATVVGLQPGLHTVIVRKDGYREVPVRTVQVGSGATVILSFPLIEADRDWDRVGDAIEIAGYTNVFLYHRNDDPDADGLTNLQEAELFRQFAVRLNIFSRDTDGDGLLDGDEVGLDGQALNMALTTLYTNSFAGGSTTRSFFSGRFLDGVNYFQNTGLTASAECDLYKATTLAFDVPVPPSVVPVTLLHNGIPTVPDSRRRLDVSHPLAAVVVADTRPDQVDTDGDGMWDGWEQIYSTNAGPIQTFLHPLECGRANEDPDGDGLTNIEEFRGADGIANTNDVLNPVSRDTDGDGMDDGWEILYGLNPRNPADAFLDGDLDGLANLAEFLFGSNPLLYDTDGDFLPDGAEAIFESNPIEIDSDGDGLIDGREVWDRDLDGLFDGGFFNNDESNWVAFDYDNDGLINGPADPDSDGDGMPDGFEVLDYNGVPLVPLSPDCTLDPLNHLDADLDCDADGLSNLQEWLVRDALYGNHPSQFDPLLAAVVWDRFLNPFNPDTDGDGLPDGWEALRGLHPYDPVRDQVGNTVLRYAALSTTGDLDGDGLWNEREYRVRFTLDPSGDPNDPDGLSTHPWIADTDEDGVGDGEEDRIFRAHPLLQDTDGDGLMDGTAVPGFHGEIESLLRTNMAIVDATNQFDQATNDLWVLRWPSAADLPTWQRMEVDPASPVPPPRWGIAATYVPVFETKNPKNNTPRFSTEENATILMDNRQLVVIGGRDGVSRHKDVWEYRVRDNMWTQSVVRLDDPYSEDPGMQAPGLDGGVSEYASVVFFGYRDTRNETCPCDNVPWNCDGTEFGEPKSRPYSDSRSFEWTYFMGGWDDFHTYFTFADDGPGSVGNEVRFYKSTDDPRPIVDSIENQKDVWEAVTTTTLRDSTGGVSVATGRVVEEDIVTNGTGRLPLGGYVDTVITVETNGIVLTSNRTVRTWVAAGLRFDETALFANCDEILSAQLVFDVRTITGDVDLDMVGEISRDQDDGGGSKEEYKVEEGTHPTGRLTPAYYNTPVTTITLPGAPGLVTNDITALVLDLVASNSFWSGDSLGLVITSSDPDFALVQTNATRLVLQLRPGFKKPPEWEDMPAGLFRYENTSAGELVRKSHAMVLDYKRIRTGFSQGIIVMFGGINGNNVLGDTYEAAFRFNDKFEPKEGIWSKVSSSNSPPARYAHSMVFDSANDRVVLFGGFDANHKPLNDLWAYKDGQWEEIVNFIDTARPMPRGGAMMAFYGDFDYNRAIGEYCVGGNKQKIILFGGTDGDVFFNDTWVFDESDSPETLPGGPRWILVNPYGEHSQSPSPRAFGSMVYAQNAGVPPDLDGDSTFRGSEDPPCATPALILFGGRTGTLPTGRDTDDDKVTDGYEFAAGGPDAGRDPRVNALFQQNSMVPFIETPPFAYKPIGTPSLNFTTAIAGMETLNWVDREYAGGAGLPWQSYPLENTQLSGFTVFAEGVDGALPQMSAQWWHRFGGENPDDARDEWELGIPSQANLGASGAPPYAYRGRWVFGTDLDNTYPNNANMQLFSPLFDLILPCSNCTSTNLSTSYFLEFYEWLNLADPNDVVRIDLIRPTTPADVQNRVSGAGKPPVPVLGNRNNLANTSNQWRRVRVPLDILGAEPQAFLRFSLVSDAAGAAGGWYIDDVSIFQGGRISGVVTNGAGQPLPGVPVDLLGSNPNQTILETTTTDANGFYQFGPLPFGSYLVDVGSSGTGVPVVLAPTAGDETANVSGPPVVMLVSVLPGEVSWAAVPGFNYRIEYTDSLVPPQVWVPLGTVNATMPIMTFVDPSPSPGFRIYRVLLVP